MIYKQKVDFRRVTLAHDARLSQYHQEWSKRFKEDSDSMGISLSPLSVISRLISLQTRDAHSAVLCFHCKFLELHYFVFEVSQ